MKPQAASAFHFKRLTPKGVVQVLNQDSYVMGEYNQQTGKVCWQRAVLATQRTNTENWLLEHYPVAGANPDAASTTLLGTSGAIEAWREVSRKERKWTKTRLESGSAGRRGWVGPERFK